MKQALDNAEYETMQDFVAAMAEGCRNPANVGLWQRWGFVDPRENRSDFYGAGCHDGNAVQKLMADGWIEGRDRMTELRDQIGTISTRPIDRRRRIVRGNAGDTLDIHSVYSGNLDTAWKSAKRRTFQAPQKVELVANMICYGGEHPDVLFWRGAAAVVLANMLETAGYMVRLVVNFGGKTFEHGDKGKKVSCRIIVKDHGRHLDITSTSSVILPGFFRALGHAWIAAHTDSVMSSGGISVGQGIVHDNEILLSHSVRDHGSAVDSSTRPLLKSMVR